MAKVKLNPIVEEVSGQVGKLVFRNLRGATILSGRPNFDGVEPSPEQVQHRERFKQAVAYGRIVLTDDQTRELYEEAADRQGKPAFALMVADFLNVPEIDEVDISQYGGNSGDPIYIRTHDDFQIEQVTVSIADGAGNILENGDASLEAEYGRWVYQGEDDHTPGTTIRISVAVADRPGGISVNEQSKTI